MLTLSHVTVRYGAREAVSDVSLRVRPGEWLMLIGPNGAGKSTLVRAIGQAVPYGGSILLQGADLSRMRSRERAARVGILAQHNGAEYAYTVEEIVQLGRYARRGGILSGGDPEGKAKVEEALRQTGLLEMRGTNVLTLSGGELQRAFLAQVFAQDPVLMVLDEPANHLDLAYQQALFSRIGEWLKTPGRAVVSVVHDLALARRFGTHAALLSGGRCVRAGAMEDVMEEGLLAGVYGMDAGEWMRALYAPWRKE